MLELNSEFLCELKADLGEHQILESTPRGTRVIVPVLGGTVEGPEIKGKVLPPGADWVLVRPDGSAELDVRITILTDDGEYIYVVYRGINNVPPEVRARIDAGEDVDPSEYYFRTTPVFETGSEKYGWLNNIICVGVGRVGPSDVHYKVYRIL